MRRTFACALAALTGCLGAILPASAALGSASAPAAGPSMATTVAAGFSWSALASSPLGSRSGALVVWAGGQLLEIGGLVGKAQRPTSAAAAFTPRTGRWRRIASVPGGAGASYSAPSGLSLYPASVWTGRYLAVANGPAKSSRREPNTATSHSATSSTGRWWAPTRCRSISRLPTYRWTRRPASARTTVGLAANWARRQTTEPSIFTGTDRP